MQKTMPNVSFHSNTSKSGTTNAPVRAISEGGVQQTENLTEKRRTGKIVLNQGVVLETDVNICLK